MSFVDAKVRIHLPEKGPCSAPESLQLFDVTSIPDWYCAKSVGFREIEPCRHCDLRVRFEILDPLPPPEK